MFRTLATWNGRGTVQIGHRYSIGTCPRGGVRTVKGRTARLERQDTRQGLRGEGSIPFGAPKGKTMECSYLAFRIIAQPESFKLPAKKSSTVMIGLANFAGSFILISASLEVPSPLPDL